jgi:NADPH-dependent curcumin reductase CurA
MTKSREIRLAARPTGWPTPETFALAEADVPEPRDGEVLVRNLFMSVDPYMRGRMNDVKSYVPPFAVGAALEGGAVGRVEVSRAPGLAKDDVVLSMKGWRERFTAPAAELQRVDASVEPLSAYLGVLGVTGLTAWAGLELVDVKAGDRVYVSAAAGATGSIAGQLAKLRGCFVVGSAGSPEKVAWLKRLGFDAAFNYRDGELGKSLRAAAPEGLDVYFDNVGGSHLEAALGAMRNYGRVIACGSIEGYNNTELAPGPRNLFFVTTKRLTIKGFIVTDAMARHGELVKVVAPLLAAGRLQARETVVDGIERAPAAFLELLRGENTGKMIVKLAD